MPKGVDFVNYLYKRESGWSCSRLQGGDIPAVDVKIGPGEDEECSSRR